MEINVRVHYGTTEGTQQSKSDTQHSEPKSAIDRLQAVKLSDKMFNSDSEVIVTVNTNGEENQTHRMSIGTAIKYLEALKGTE